jgi:orotidine-5'-phosphate decarboxylase
MPREGKDADMGPSEGSGRGVAFAERLYGAVKAKDTRVCVGLDPVLDRIPAEVVQSSLARHGNSLLAVAMAFVEFGRGIIDAVGDYAAAVKPQAAFYEACGPAGMYALQELIRYAQQRGLLVIEDAKRGDIGSTAEAYALGHLGLTPLPGGGAEAGFTPDALTINPYLGRDGLLPFVQACREHGRGVFVLVRTSNPSAGDLQDLDASGQPVYLRVAELLAGMASGLEGPSGYSPIGAVVGATYPQQAAAVRRMMPASWLLVPGYGAQGAGAEDVLPCFDAKGYGAVVNSSRGIICAHQSRWAREMGLGWREAAAEASRRMRDEINLALASRGAHHG